MTFRDAVQFFIFQTTRFLSPMAVATEWVLVAIATILAGSLPCRSNRTPYRLRDAFCRLAKRKKLAILICAALPVSVRLLMLGFDSVPDPSIHDEFSHLLLADTLAHGRLTNPTHPMWMHFESIHIIQQPTYNSMYPPGQGAFLALGQLVFREPWAGVVISVGLMFAAICWMMQCWLPPAWAFFGTLVAILKFGVVGFWMNSYLGGAVSAIGGALLVGSVAKLKGRNFQTIHAVLAGLGLIFLMNTRPFEGAVLSVAALGYLLLALGQRAQRNWKHLFLRIFLPVGLILSAGILFAGYYAWRVTGNPLHLPYQVNRDTYGWPENLAFLAPKKLTLRHDAMQDMYTKEIRHHDVYATPDRIFDNLNTRLFDNWTFFVGPTLTVPLLFMPWVFRDRRTRPLVIFLSIIAILNLFQLVLYPYHLGPVVPVIFAIVAQAMRHLYVSVSQRNRWRGIYFAIILPACLIVVGAMKHQAIELGIPMAYWEYGFEGHRDTRAALENWLRARPRQQLVIVRYAAEHPPDREWVYNSADIDGSKVVWAREMDLQSNARLLKYFSDREIWLLQADVFPQRVVPYRLAEAQEALSSRSTNSTSLSKDSTRSVKP